MMNRFNAKNTAIASLVLVAVMTGCASTRPTTYYTLNAINDNTAPLKHQDITVGISPVEIPDYLDRPHIVTRTAQNELRVSDFNRWAGSLREDIARVMAENLSVLLSTSRVYVFPWIQSSPLDYRVKVKITRFEGKPGGSVVLKADWYIYNDRDKTLLMHDVSNFREETGKQGYHALVAAESRAVEGLSRVIAETISSLSQE